MALKFLPFYVHLTDQAEVARLQALYPSGYIVAPRTGAAVEFSAPWQGYSSPATSPATWTPYSGAETKYYWVANFKYVPATAAPASGSSGNPTTDPVERVNIPDRRWNDGFELVGTAGSTTSLISRDASRSGDGFGLA